MLPVRFIRQIGEAVQDAIEDHEDRMHVPPINRDPVTAVPYPCVRLSDVQVSKALELMYPLGGEDGLDLAAAAAHVGVPKFLLERHLVEYGQRYRRWLMERGVAVF